MVLKWQVAPSPWAPLYVLANNQEKHLVNALVNTLVNALVNASLLSSVSRQLCVLHAKDLQSRQVRKSFRRRAQAHVTARQGRAQLGTAG